MLTRKTVAILAALSASACSTSDLTSPADDGLPSGPSTALVDAGHGGPVDGFYFLPPLAKQASPVGEFDPTLNPGMYVCELTGNPSAVANPGGWESVACVTSGGDPVVVASFAPGTASTSGSNYQFSWDTDDGPENISAMDPAKFYRLVVTYRGYTLGYLDVNPQRPSGQSPGADYEDLYAFRIGETLPVKFFSTTQSRCTLSDDPYVLQCVAQGVIDESGGVVSLEPVEEEGWVRMSTVVPPGALPVGYPQIILTLERIDPDLYLATTGEGCIPGLGLGAGADMPRFGDCLRVTTDPELPLGLELAALIEICLDPLSYAGVKFDEEQDTRLQIIRYGGGVIQGLPNVDATTCPAIQTPAELAGFFPVPREEGFLRTAAIAFNRLGRILGPEPLVAHGSIRLGGSTTVFSNFQFGLPGEMVKVAGDAVIIQQQEDGSESYDVTATVKVVDSGSQGPEPSTIEGATVHFSGSVSVSPTDVTTGADGLASTSWAVPQTGPGVYTMSAKAVGLLDESVPDHQFLVPFPEVEVQFSATVVGLPSNSTQSPPSGATLEGAPGETLSTPLVITVVDQNGQPVAGYPVTWDACAGSDPSCDGSIAGDAVTDENGQATGYWTLSSTPGTNTATARVGSVQLDFLAGSWTAVGTCAVTVDGAMGDGEWDCAQSASFVANIAGGGGVPAEVRWQRDGSNLYMLVRVQQSSLAKVNSLRIDFDNTLNGPSADDDAIGFDADGGGTGGTFIDQYLTQQCVNKGQAGCGAPDTSAGGSTDGHGALGNDGTYTVFELSHPLSGDAGLDFTLSPANPRIGFFLTLTNGNGAQGNTQFPGFRRYLTIDY